MNRFVSLLTLLLCVAVALGGVACAPPVEAPPCEGPSCPVCTPGDQRQCYTGEPQELASGVCRQGDQFCDGSGQWGPCEGEVKPVAEVCGDTRDNNCNGVVDDGCECRPGESRKCGFAVGICKQGQQSCKADGKWSDCIGQVKPKEEVCDGNEDENCDGIIDENCTCSQGAERDCGSTEGECSPGKQTCGNDGQWGACVGEVKPTPETCDQKDNDCNGMIDDNIACP